MTTCAVLLLTAAAAAAAGGGAPRGPALTKANSTNSSPGRTYAVISDTFIVDFQAASATESPATLIASGPWKIPDEDYDLLVFSPDTASVDTDTGLLTLSVDDDHCPYRCLGAQFRAAEVKLDGLLGLGLTEVRLRASDKRSMITRFSLWTSTGAPNFERLTDFSVTIVGRGREHPGTVHLNHWRGADEHPTQMPLALDFSPTADFHSYGIWRDLHHLKFLIDGEAVATWKGDFSLTTFPPAHAIVTVYPSNLARPPFADDYGAGQGSTTTASRACATHVDWLRYSANGGGQLPAVRPDPPRPSRAMELPKSPPLMPATASAAPLPSVRDATLPLLSALDLSDADAVQAFDEPSEIYLDDFYAGFSSNAAPEVGSVRFVASGPWALETKVMGFLSGWQPETASISDGSLRLAITDEGCDGGGCVDGRPFKSAEVSTVGLVKEGYLEARIKASSKKAAITGMFIWRHAGKVNGYARLSEFDVEFIGRGAADGADLQVNWWLPSEATSDRAESREAVDRAQHPSRVALWFDPTAEYHTYGIERTADAIVFWVDDRRVTLMWDDPRVAAFPPGRAVFNAWACQSNDWGCTPPRFEDDYDAPTEAAIDFVRWSARGRTGPSLDQSPAPTPQVKGKGPWYAVAPPPRPEAGNAQKTSSNPAERAGHVPDRFSVVPMVLVLVCGLLAVGGLVLRRVAHHLVSRGGSKPRYARVEMSEASRGTV